MYRFLSKIFRVLSWIMFAILVVGWLDQGVRWAIKNLDPYYKKILLAKTKDGYDLASTGEQIVTILNRAGSNGTAEKIVTES